MNKKCLHFVTGTPENSLKYETNSSVSAYLFSLFHDSWNAFPTFVLLDHTMTVRAKPWNLENNSNTSSCDGSNTTIGIEGTGWAQLRLTGGGSENYITSDDNLSFERNIIN